jgi:hypothetical protein
MITTKAIPPRKIPYNRAPLQPVFTPISTRPNYMYVMGVNHSSTQLTASDSFDYSTLTFISGPAIPPQAQLDEEYISLVSIQAINDMTDNFNIQLQSGIQSDAYIDPNGTPIPLYYPSTLQDQNIWTQIIVSFGLLDANTFLAYDPATETIVTVELDLSGVQQLESDFNDYRILLYETLRNNIFSVLLAVTPVQIIAARKWTPWIKYLPVQLGA